ncbi:DUF397 domain-containing protein [Actinocorallia sp. API 0066]|uniref:DUF397 domain-containing protein n=1 Tax=Actinocorallia sp. API 0066 TaxID=2896846 RepID=UPI001E420A76|nr:DUF397 domain-containing protein [Actinocorallia sp. API 0066]MCD0450578.1 DUF397 domain-containing protein [Actinocorallia sp. API 0066]
MKLDVSTAQWRKSSHSSGQGELCVEVAPLPTVIAIRDSKHPNGHVHAFPRAAFRALTQSLRSPHPTP